MLIKQQILDAIAAGKVDLAFRRWDRARVKEGSRLRTAVGVLEVEAVDTVAMTDITDRAARRAGYDGRESLLGELKRRPGKVFKIELRLAGPDPRVALRQNARITASEREEIDKRLARLDAASRHGAWTRKVLRLIEENPAVRAPDLATRLGRDTRPFKIDVRKLKELGLTESLEVGYRLSPRGRAFLARDRIPS